ncbi:MAG TPA: hypothetical protein PKE55_02050 [Kiritimatiellia bacterium]|nr:hypothetical protein [Kiritimatiellia bacterium]
MTTPPTLTLHAPGIDAETVVREIHATVERKTAEGVYADARIARAERSNLANLRNNEDFLAYYLQSLRAAATVDINDFEIRERRARFAPLLIKFKRTLWNLLKFYTYRLWSQQNTINGLLVTGIEGLDESMTARIQKLEQRIADLEAQLKQEADKPS